MKHGLIVRDSDVGTGRLRTNHSMESVYSDSKERNSFVIHFSFVTEFTEIDRW